jgi:hypothetical protein
MTMNPSARKSTFLGLAALFLGWTPAAMADDGSAIPTYSGEVARILNDNCVSCHRPGIQFTPMGLTDFESVRPWAKSIRTAVANRTMPPWHANPDYGHFANDISLSVAEVDTIVRWVDAGAPQGDPSVAPEPPPLVEGWQIGEPDVIIDMGRDFEVPAEGVVPYQFFTVKTDFPEDMWVQAMEAKAGNLDVVHHIVIYLRNPREGIPNPDAGRFGNGLLGALSPGNTPSVYMPGQGKLLKKGAVLVFNMHYNTNGVAATDRSYVGLKFHKAPVKQQVVTRGIETIDFAIPPHDPNYEIRSEHTFPEDSTLISLMPHMHYRGKDFRYTAYYPDGTEEVLLDVPNYNFDWQVYYHLAEPKKLPAGTRIECVAHMDNSAGNPLNPDPNDTVRFGQQTFEEMMIGWIDYTRDNEDLTQYRYASSDVNP